MTKENKLLGLKAAISILEKEIGAISKMELEIIALYPKYFWQKKPVIIKELELISKDFHSVSFGSFKERMIRERKNKIIEANNQIKKLSK